MSSKERKKRYIENLKQKGMYDDFKKKHAAEMRESRKCTEEEKSHQRELSKLRMQRYRQRKLEEAAVRPTPPSTRAAEEKKKEKREVWKLAKQKYREKMRKERPQKFRRVKEKERKRKRIVRENDVEEANEDNQDNEVISPSARRKAVSRVKASLPKRSSVAAVVISDLITKASPRKRKIIEEEGISVSHKK